MNWYMNKMSRRICKYAYIQRENYKGRNGKINKTDMYKIKKMPYEIPDNENKRK